MYSKGVFLYLPWGKKSWGKQINFINSLTGVSHVEIWIEEDLSLSDLKFLKISLKKYKIIIHAPWIHLGLVSPHKEIQNITIKIYLQTLKIADYLEAKLVTFHCGSKTVYLSREMAAEILIQNLKKIKSSYRGKINFSIENVAAKIRGPQVSYPNLSDLSYLKNKFSLLNLTLDIGHAIEDGNNLKSILIFLKKYKNSILDIHLHDAVFRGKAHLALGKGDLDLVKFLNLLRKINYQGYLSLETISFNDTRFSWRKLLLIERKLKI